MERLSDAQLADMMKLMSRADSVELKVTVPDVEGRHTMNALEMDPLDAQIRQVVFFDTPELTLNQHGLVVRARRSQGSSDDSVIKLRPVEPADLSDQLRSTSDFVVEVDAMPGGFVCSASYKGTLTTGVVKEVLAGRTQIRKLFSKAQRAFFDQHAPDGIGLDDLTVLGPITVLKLKHTPEGFNGRRLVGEMWFYPDGSRIVELSTKCDPNIAFQVSAEARAFLHERGVNLTGEQQTKTRTALEFFAASASVSA
jgi:hypothetical protein